MKTKLISTLQPEFQFAGFTWPRFVGTLPTGPLSKRLADRKGDFMCGESYHKPTPNVRGSIGFYMGRDGVPDILRLRWQWCDEVEGVRISHTGWYCDEYGDGDKMRGLVFRLPRGRGFLAGYSMGEGMASTLDRTVYEDEDTAAYSADSMAESAAEDEQLYQASERERQAEEDAEQHEREARETQEREDAEVARLTPEAEAIIDGLYQAGAESHADSFRVICQRAGIPLAVK